MQGPRTNAAGWAQAGRNAGKSYAHITETTRKYSPRYDELAEVGLKTRSQEKQAAIAAESQARRAEISAETHLKKADIAIDKFESINKSKGTIRKAGMVAAAGSAIGMALLPEEEAVRPETVDFSKYENYFKEQQAKDEATLAERFGGGDRTDPDTAPTDYQKVASKPNQPGSTSFQPKPTGGTAGKVSTPSGKGGKGLRLMDSLVGQGYSPVSAAAIAGNAAHESGNFRHYEELAPNAYGTKGVGFLQWTNAGGGNRRSEFENWSRTQGLDPTSFEASAGYIDAEMRGGRHWTGGMNTDSFKGIEDLNEATRAFQNNYLRPNKNTAGTDARLNYANQFYTDYMNR